MSPTSTTAKPSSAQAPTTPAPTPNADGTATSKAGGQFSEPQERFILFGQLRRDTMILAHGTDRDELATNAESAVREGRAATAFLVKAEGFFSEAEVDFRPTPSAAPTQYFDEADNRVPLLNPSTGEQAADAAQADPGSAPTAPIPTHGATQGGDDNKGAGTGTGNEAPLKGADSVNDKKAS